MRQELEKVLQFETYRRFALIFIALVVVSTFPHNHTF